MLPLTQKHGVFICQPRDHAPGTCPAGGRRDWVRGKKLLGFVKVSGRMLTDGTDDPTFMKCEWVKVFGERPGFTIFESSNLGRIIFSRKDVEAVFIGEPECGPYECAFPKLVAIPTDALHPISRKEFKAGVESYSVECTLDTALSVSAQFGPDIEVVPDLFQYQCRVIPRTPLSRQVWSALGYHIPTKQPEALTGVLVKDWNPQNVILPFSAIEDITAHGLSVKASKATTDSSPRIVADSFTVDDPSLAAAVYPILAKADPGTAVHVRGKIQLSTFLSEAFFPVTCGEALESFPSSTTFLGGASPYWITYPSSVRVLPGKVLFGELADRRGVAIVASEQDLDSLFVPARSAVAKYSIPDTIQPRQVYVAGAPAPGNYYLASDLASLPSGASKRQRMRGRAARLQEQYGESLPANWKKLTDEQIEATVTWHRNRKAGWLNRREMAEALGLPPDPAPDWYAAFDIPFIEAPDHERIYPPTTFEALRDHENFGKQCRVLFGKGEKFILQCLFDEQARAAIFASMMA